MDDYARAFEETEAERDELRRVNGLLAGTLARYHDADDEVAATERPPEEFPSFAELIGAATATLKHLAITAEPAPGRDPRPPPESPAPGGGRRGTRSAPSTRTRARA